MSEIRKVIGSVNVTNTNIKCPGCGASNIHFEPSTATLSCPFCGLESKLPTPQYGVSADELDFNTPLQRSSVDWGRYKKLMVCANCGGQTVYDSEQITGVCPFCGSTSVAPAAETDQVMVPNAVIPFSFDKEKAQEYFHAFLKRKRLVNKKVFNCKLENIVGIYLPFWTFDAFTASTFYARRLGRNRYNNEVIGNWYQFIDDVVIFASDRVRHPFISKVQEFDFEKAMPYSPEYLAGIPAERYTLGLNEGWDRTKNLINRKLKRDLNRSHRDIFVHKVDSNYYNVRFRYLLAPVYLATYRFGNKVLPVAINGQTGKTYCDVPTRIRKLILIGIILLLVGAAIEAAALWLLHLPALGL